MNYFRRSKFTSVPRSPRISREFLIRKAEAILRRTWAPLKALIHLSRLAVTQPRTFQNLASAWARRNIVVYLLVVLWIAFLRWGEFILFEDSIRSCDWHLWEHWPNTAVPHHLVFVADPQLVDPHTYPGRPWPLSSLTVAHTDLYLKRAYGRIQRELDPNTVFFLGDLFDGGREWSTRTTVSPEEQYRRYGDDFWAREYMRFSNIFFKDRTTGLHTDKHIIASLPGNHDLGFASGIQIPVRERFNAYFGESNRIDIIANHTFVSLDTVSLSAKDRADAPETRDIWGPADVFLDTAYERKQNAEQRHLQHLQDLHDVADRPQRVATTPSASDKTFEHSSNPAYNNSEASFPTILLTHVPLYRAPGTPCGPMREKYPPTPPPAGQTEPVEPDERNALLVAGGYQYQNVLSQTISAEVINALRGKISWVFSGDDHDYCEVVHRAYPSTGGGVHEITVKSISWAMGVRRPGFLLVSLWNEVDQNGGRVGTVNGLPTLQTKLCLLPDQLSIFIVYGKLIGFSLAILLLRALLIPMFPATFAPTPWPSSSQSLLPTHSADAKKRDASPFSNIGASDFNQPKSFSSQLSTNQTSSATSRPVGMSALSLSADEGSGPVSRALGSRAPRSRGISPARLDHGGYTLDNPSPPPYGFQSRSSPFQAPPRTSSLHASQNIPLVNQARNNPQYDNDADDDTEAKGWGSARRKAGETRKIQVIVAEFVHSIGVVGGFSIFWYLWLLYY